MNNYWHFVIFLLINLDLTVHVQSNDEISDHISKCCIFGMRYARKSSKCDSYEYEVAAIPPLWRGLCYSTYGVCCSREIEKQHCLAGRQAALRGSRCDEQLNTTTYSNCCLSCQVGLAVKASDNNCNDKLFSYFSNIESYRLCCDINGTNFTDVNEDEINGGGNDDGEADDKHNTLSEEGRNRVRDRDYPLNESEINTNGTDGAIVLQDDDDDICGKVPNLCAHICENTKEAYHCKCNPGYKLDDNNVTCTLITGGGDANVQDHIAATNNFDKHKLNRTGETIEEDYDECSYIPCVAGYHCINNRGRYECKKPTSDEAHTTKINNILAEHDKCGDGFQLRHGRCIDIDECLIEDACDSSQVCTNDIGGYRCDCKIGFNLDTTTNACVDINECSINNHNCLPTQRCDNTVGSYICTRLQSCGTGYTLNAETGNCDDDDECALDTHNCPADYECYNTRGSFRCYRRPPATIATTTKATTTLPPKLGSGRIYTNYRNHTPSYAYPGYVSQQTDSHNHMRDYMLQSIGGSDIEQQEKSLCSLGFHRNHLGACVDMNECVLSNPCGSHQRCINTNGSYRCHNLLQCVAGYKSTPDGTSCIDIDECETGEHNCAENQICRNRNGGYICSCLPGHQMQHMREGTTSRCVDINECEQEHPPVCPSNAQCLNTIGSYYCECKSGFQKSKENDRICLDVDECQEIPGLCQQKCVNFWGGYRCTCNPGYELSVDNRTCNDVDECDVHKSYKLCMGFCNNVPGSYECSCPRSYTLAMDKNTCRDIDECATGEFCTGRYDICTNTRGSYKCTTIHCQYGYVNDPDQKNRCRQTSNLCEGDECYNKPSAYTYNFITLVSKLMIPPEGRKIFSLRSPPWYDDIDFNWKIVKIQAAANIEKASDNHFDTIKGRYEVHLSLKRSLEGPQDIELELSMTVFTNGMPRGKSVAKIFILVSQYTF